MKINIAYILFGIVALCASCYHDIGNYDYHEPEDPIVSGLKNASFVSYIGDSLIIKPKITHSLYGTEGLSYEWQIDDHLDMKTILYSGPALRMLFNLKPAIYSAKLTVTNNTNGIKYFYKFKIEGKTEFTSGTVVLSNDGGVSRLSFIKSGTDLRANLYEGLHGENLPNDPKQIFIVDNYWFKSYQVITGEVNKPGVIIDAATMIRTKYLEDNFFEKPSAIHMDNLTVRMEGVTAGIINKKLYCGTWQTFAGSSLFGVYGAMAGGDYELSPYFNFYMSHYLAYDILHKKFIQFDGSSLSFMGDGYEVVPTGDGPFFDPKNLDIDLLYLKNIDSEKSYAFGRDENGIVNEYKFMDVPGVFFPASMQTFVGSDLVKDNTKWQASEIDNIFYFTSDDKIYRYNPENLTIQTLDADFGGKTISMIKLIDANLLLAGTDGELHYMDVSTGQNGKIFRVIKNIPGSPVDVVVRK